MNMKTEVKLRMSCIYIVHHVYCKMALLPQFKVTAKTQRSIKLMVGG